MKIGAVGLEGEITTDIAIDTDCIPEAAKDELAAAILEGVKEYFQQPGVKEKFDIWLAARRLRIESSGSRA